MLVNVNSIIYRVKWQYYPKVKFPYVSTCCFIETKKPNEVISGIAFVSKKDSFNYDKGRKVSLERALYELFSTNKEARLLFWKEYFNMTHKDYLEKKTVTFSSII